MSIKSSRLIDSLNTSIDEANNKNIFYLTVVNNMSIFDNSKGCLLLSPSFATIIYTIVNITTQHGSYRHAYAVPNSQGLIRIAIGLTL